MPVLTIRPTGLAVASKATAPTAAPGVLEPPDSTSPDPSLRNPYCVIWNPSTTVRSSEAPAPNPMPMRFAALPSSIETR